MRVCFPCASVYYAILCTFVLHTFLMYTYVCTCVQACQKADKNYGLGDISTVSCDVSQSTPSNNTWIIKLSYTGGSDGRKCDFTFVYSPSDAQPELTFDQEKPGLDYVSSYNCI